MNFLVIGCGSIGKRHIGNLLADGHKVVAWNRGVERRQQVEEEFNIQVYADYHEALEHEGLNAVYICTPNNLHVANSLDATRKGYDLFMEKPVGINEEGLEELVSEIERRNLVSHIGCNMRFHLGPQCLKEKLQANELGKPLSAQVWAGMALKDWHPLEDHRQMYSAKKELGGGAVLDFIHEIDLTLWLFGMPDKVVGMTTNSGYLEIETEECADILFGYTEKNMVANVHVDYLQRPFQRGIRIIGEKAIAEWDLNKECVELIDMETQEKSVVEFPVAYEKNDMYLAQQRYFIDCLATRKKSNADVLAGWNALKVAIMTKNEL